MALCVVNLGAAAQRHHNFPCRNPKMGILLLLNILLGQKEKSSKGPASPFIPPGKPCPLQPSLGAQLCGQQSMFCSLRWVMDNDSRLWTADPVSWECFWTCRWKLGTKMGTGTAAGSSGLVRNQLCWCCCSSASVSSGAAFILKDRSRGYSVD